VKLSGAENLAISYGTSVGDRDKLLPKDFPLETFFFFVKPFYSISLLANY
jgi:hypothetical protein